jgi:hypothetical protein
MADQGRDREGAVRPVLQEAVLASGVAESVPRAQVEAARAARALDRLVRD